MSRARSSEFPRGEPFLLLAVIVLVLYFARELLIPLVFALTLTFLLAPAVDRLEKLRLPRLPAVALVGAVACVFLFGVGYVVARQLLHVAQTLPTYRLTLQEKVASVHSPTERSIEKAFSTVEDIGADLAASAAPPAPVIWPNAPLQQPQPVRIIDPNRSQLQAAGQLALTILKPIGTIGVIIVFTIYMLLKREELRNRLLLLAGMGHINLMTQALEDAANRISQYLVMQVAVNAAYGLSFGIGLHFIGVPDSTLWGAIAAILRVIPYVGTATSLILPLIVSVAISTTWWPPILVICLFLVLELSVTNFLEPWLYGSRTGISSLALLVMAIFWALLWGWAGLVLSTPLTVCMVVLGRYVPQMSFLHTLLGSDAELSADAHFYERLLAMDQTEAHAIADRFLQGKPLVELYDSVLVPALSLAEQDRHQGVLDDVRSNFLFLSIGELVAELTSYRQKDLPDLTDHSPGDNMQSDNGAKENAPSERELSSRAPLVPARKEFAVVCISASDQADELTTLMLAQLMERADHSTLLLSATSLSTELLDTLAKEPETVVFISALPPFAFSHARAICQRVRAHLPNNRICIGFWNSTDDLDQTIERFGNGRPTVVIGTLSQALQQVAQWQE
jgi:predicted PurR-regulated permease PerM